MNKAASTSRLMSERLQKPGWKDPKLLLGLLLILASIVAVVGIVKVTNQTEEFFVAKHEVAVGDIVTAEDFAVKKVRLGEANHLYLSADAQIPEHAVSHQHMLSGQLIETNALNEQKKDGRREVTVTLDSTVASTLKSGDLVDVWVSHKEDNGTKYSEPKSVMNGAEINKISTEESMIGSTGKSAVQLLVSENSLTDVLDANNNESRISLIPTTFTRSQR